MTVEAAVVRDVVAQMNRRLPVGDRWDLYHWAEAEGPWPATGTWQQFIPRASDPNVSVAIFLIGERLGVPLPDYFPLPPDVVLPAWISFPWTADGATVPLTGTVFELLDALSAAERAPLNVLCYAKVDGRRFTRTGLPADERRYGFEHHYDRLRNGENRIRNRALHNEYSEQIELLDRFCTAFFRGESHPLTFFGSDAGGSEGAREAFRALVHRDLYSVLGVAAATAQPRKLKGLAPLERADSDLLFGRDRQIARLLDRLRQRARDARSGTPEGPLLALVGRSGEGKSSLLRAGVLGRLDDGRYFDYGTFTTVLVDGSVVGAVQPLPALSSAISNALRDASGTALWDGAISLDELLAEARVDALVDGVRAALAAVRTDVAGRTRRLCIVVDQFETLLLHESDEQHRDVHALLTALSALANADLAWSVVALSTEHVDRLIRLRPEFASAIETLQPPGPDDLIEIIERSLSVAGVRATASEVSEIFLQADAWLTRQADPGPVLPLLAALLAEIAEPRRDASQAAPADAPAATPLALDGVVDRLAERACDRAFGPHSMWRGKLVEELLRQLVDTGVTISGPFAIARECRDDHPAVVQARPLVDALLEERLLYRSRPGHLRLVHVSIIEYWKAASEWYRADRRFQEIFVHLQQRAQWWLELGTPEQDHGLLVDPVDLGDALELWGAWFEQSDLLPVDFLRRSFLWAYRSAMWSDDDLVFGNYNVCGAIAANDRELIEAVLARVAQLEEPARRAIINGAFVDAGHPIRIATMRGNSEVFARLVAMGATTDLAGEDGTTLLHHAVAADDLTTIRFLIESGADVNATGTNGDSVLIAAVRWGRTDVARRAVLAATLLEAGARADAIDGRGTTALGHASGLGQSETVDVLLRHGADVEARDRDGWTALAAAIVNGHQDIVGRLLAHGAGADDVMMGDDALTVAIRHGDRAIISELLDHGVTIDRRTEHGLIPLVLAVLAGSAAIVADLLDRGARVDQTTANGATALIAAAEGGQLDVLRVLLDRGARIGVASDVGVTPLVAAVAGGHRAVVDELLAHGADVTSVEPGMSPLPVAAGRGWTEIARLLLDRGANVEAATVNGSPALSFAASEGHLDAVQLLIERGAHLDRPDGRNGDSALTAAAYCGHTDVVRALLAHGASIEYARGKDERRALSHAARLGHDETVRALLEAGALADARDRAGATALFFAAREGHAAVVQTLLAAGANPTLAAVEDDAPEPLSPVQIAEQRGHRTIVELLLAALAARR